MFLSQPTSSSRIARLKQCSVTRLVSAQVRRERTGFRVSQTNLSIVILSSDSTDSNWPFSLSTAEYLRDCGSSFSSPPSCTRFFRVVNLLFDSWRGRGGRSANAAD
jgi:hypothetical protein